MTVLVGAGAHWAPVGVEPPAEYVQTAEGRAAVQEALDLIQMRHDAEYPRCALCGQPSARIDDFGLCQKISVPHVKWRNQVLARERTSGRRSVSRPRRRAEFVS